jgi:hypothetical protein
MKDDFMKVGGITQKSLVNLQTIQKQIANCIADGFSPQTTNLGLLTQFELIIRDLKTAHETMKRVSESSQPIQLCGKCK